MFFAMLLISTLLITNQANNMSVSSIYGEYAQLESLLSELEAKKEKLCPYIIEMMTANQEEKIDIGVGKFSLTPRKVWTYTDEVAELADTLKAKKAKEESMGEATFEEVPSLRYTAAKI
jgi:hypothetical protein